MREQSCDQAHEKDFRNLSEYRRFAARLMRVRDERTAVELASQTYHVNTEEQNLQIINAFYGYIEYYPTYQQKCYEHVTQERKRYGNMYPLVHDTSPHPDYDYAARYTGICGDFVRNTVEVLYKIACERPQSEVGQILTSIRNEKW